ncbi:Methylmalonyl-CoA mutase [Geodia barretti]|uniref:Methylmalonyl-CoA mutase n=1 Tax=Geodia barretti TaxID=519541 RepID=A0AA35TS25_GEOBA|nr:Methylmalonyl-CoA mutase [Geodia barretti]
MREIGDAAYRHRQEVESGDRIIVGVNRYANDEPPVEDLMRVDEEAARQQVARLERLRRERDGGVSQAALARLADIARGADNTVPAILECVNAYCTLGEMSAVLREAFGEQEEMAAF